MATRRWRTPRPLAWLGLVSYSVYLVHYVLIQVLRPVLNQRLPEAPAVIVFLVVLFGLSWLTHRFVEVPGQRWSRHRGLLLPQVQPGEQVVRR